MPDALKCLLVDDWEYITKDQQVVALPHKFPVAKILDDYHEEEQSKRASSIDIDVLAEVIAGIKEYFNKALGKILLYRFERDQYDALRKRMEAPTGNLSGKEPCDVYGPEHLCRLFGTSSPLVAIRIPSVFLDD